MILIPLLLSIVAAFADVIGGSFTLFKRLGTQNMTLITAIGSGFLLGATLLDRLPDAMEQLPSTAPVFIVAGYLLMLLLERYGFTHTHTHDQECNHEHHNTQNIVTAAYVDSSTNFMPLMDRKSSIIAFIGLLIHTFMDGVVVAGSFSINRATGFLIFLAITMHKLPEGFSMATISLASGSSQKRAFGTSVALAVSTIIGASVTLWIGTVDVYAIKVILALATGTFIFITTTSLIPAVKKSQDSKVIFAIIGSVVVFYLALLLIKHVGLS